MLCEECGIREAQVTVTTVVNGEKNQLRLCRECVKKYQPGGDMSGLLAAILSSMAKAHAASDKVCSHCGMSLAEFRKGGVLGCAGCYEDFREELKPVLTKIQGRSQHAGRRPRGSEEQEARLSRIRELDGSTLSPLAPNGSGSNLRYEIYSGEILKITATNGKLYEVPNGNIIVGLRYQLQIEVEYTIEF